MAGILNMWKSSKSALWALVVLLIGALGYQRKDRKLDEAKAAVAVAEQNEQVSKEVLEDVVSSVEFRESVSDLSSDGIDSKLQQSGYFRD